MQLNADPSHFDKPISTKYISTSRFRQRLFGQINFRQGIFRQINFRQRIFGQIFFRQAYFDKVHFDKDITTK